MSQPLTSSIGLSQEIAPECPGLTEVRVWMGASADKSGATTLTFSDVGRSAELTGITVANVDLIEPGWQRLEFMPDWDSMARRYLLEIRGEQSEPGPQVGYTIRPENPAVRLWINGEKSELDLVYQYGCLAGIERVLH